MTLWNILVERRLETINISDKFDRFEMLVTDFSRFRLTPTSRHQNYDSAINNLKRA